MVSVALPPTRAARDGSELLLVPAGDFRMGTADDEAERLLRQYRWRPDRFHNERPQHTVSMRAYYIARYPVTVAQYARYIEAAGAKVPDCWDDPRFTAPDQPVIGVERKEAIAYASWAGLRLPSEAEWEKASRGTDGRTWPWGNEWDGGRVNSAEHGRGYPTAVTWSESRGNVSPYGLADTVGNVWEWCLDRYVANYYADSPRENPVCTKPEVHYDGYYSMRGGSWLNQADMCRCAARYDRFDQQRRRHLGFRCAADAEVQS